MVHHTTIGPLNIWVSERHTIPLRPINVVIGESYTQHLQETGALLHLATTHHIQDTIVVQDQVAPQPPALSQTPARSNPPAVEDPVNSTSLATNPIGEEEKQATSALSPPSTREIQPTDPHDTAARDDGSPAEHQAATIQAPSTASPEEEHKAPNLPIVGKNATSEGTHHGTVVEPVPNNPAWDQPEDLKASPKTGGETPAVDSSTSGEPDSSRKDIPAVEENSVPQSPADLQKGKEGFAASYYDKSKNFDDIDRGRSASRKGADDTPLANVPDEVEGEGTTTAAGGVDTQAAGSTDPEKSVERPGHTEKLKIDAPGPTDPSSRDGSVSGSTARTVGDVPGPLQEVAASPDEVNANGDTPNVAIAPGETPEKTKEDVLKAPSPTPNSSEEASPSSSHVEKPKSAKEVNNEIVTGTGDQTTASTSGIEHISSEPDSATGPVVNGHPEGEHKRVTSSDTGRGTLAAGSGATEPSKGHVRQANVERSHAGSDHGSSHQNETDGTRKTPEGGAENKDPEDPSEKGDDDNAGPSAAEAPTDAPVPEPFVLDSPDDTREKAEDNQQLDTGARILDSGDHQNSSASGHSPRAHSTSTGPPSNSNGFVPPTSSTNGEHGRPDSELRTAAPQPPVHDAGSGEQAGPTKPDSGHSIGHTITRNGSQGPQPAPLVLEAPPLDHMSTPQAHAA